jgi:hypothetical protein
MKIFTKQEILELSGYEDSALYDALRDRRLIPSVYRSDGPGRANLYSFNDAVMAALLHPLRDLFNGYPHWVGRLALFLSGYQDLEEVEEPPALLIYLGSLSEPIEVHPIWPGQERMVAVPTARNPVQLLIPLLPLVERVRDLAGRDQERDRELAVA